MRNSNRSNMNLLGLFFAAYCGLTVATSSSPSGWSFSAGKAMVAKKGDTEGTSATFGPGNPIASPLDLGAKESLRLTFTLQDRSTVGRPHQAFLLLKDSLSDLETFYPLSVKESSGKAKIDLSHKEIPAHLLDAEILSLSLALGSFGDSPASLTNIGTIKPVIDPASRNAIEQQKAKDLGEGNVIYKPKDEIRHIFRPEPQSPNIWITLPFVGAVLAGLVALFGVWFAALGGNFTHFPKALQAAPLSHPVFFGSLMALEGLFFLYYTTWNLFETLIGVCVVGVIATFSGSRALREVRSRRERGEI
ncbi:Oligosaccharyltransferase subunit Ribophorin II-domain-containing protein [Geopyxis carbonaria]|nr:Oligosaccharyltransferase subunit Ribophorin II-domain-containing protein [Geopyxis carbonaria]